MPAGLVPFLDGSGTDRTDTNRPWAGIYLYSLQARRMSRAAWLSPGTVLAPPAGHALRLSRGALGSSASAGFIFPGRLGQDLREGVLFLTIAFFFWGAIRRSSRTLAVQRPLVGVFCPAERDRLPGRRVLLLRPLLLAPRRRLRAVGVPLGQWPFGASRTGQDFVAWIYIYVQVSVILVAVCAQSALLKETSATFRSLAHARSASGHPCR